MFVKTFTARDRVTFRKYYVKSEKEKKMAQKIGEKSIKKDRSHMSAVPYWRRSA